MGPLRNRSSSRHYDPELFENWTIARLKEELRNLNINFPVNARRMALVRILKQAKSDLSSIDTDRRGSRNDQDTSTHDANADVNNLEDRPISLFGSARANQDGRAQYREREIIDIVGKLSNTVQSLQQNVTNLTAKVSRIVCNNTDAVNRAENLPTSRQDQDIANTSASPSENFNLESAYRALNSTSFRGLGTPSAAAGNEQQLRNMTRHSAWGFAAENLPYVETISPQLKKNILSGMDINLSTLLIPYYNGSGFTTELTEGDSKTKPDLRTAKTLNIGEFIQAFGIYKNIMCSAYPLRRQELDLYERDIIDMASRYPGHGFYEYHKRFSAEAAAHLRYNNTAIDWSIRNNTLFCNIFANVRPNSCALCGSTFHTTGFCNKNIHVRPRNTGNRMEEIDTYGRDRVNFQGREICNNFNGSKGCVAFRCRNLHICLVCKGEHAKLKCPLVAKNDSVGSLKPGAPLKRF